MKSRKTWMMRIWTRPSGEATGTQRGVPCSAAGKRGALARVLSSGLIRSVVCGVLLGSTTAVWSGEAVPDDSTELSLETYRDVAYTKQDQRE
ncbi:MAG: hypothetical protein KDA60_21660, partial [Planctomycetales bacterium]|nr:hypothetical protein [Planctomycetales bacterium]